MTATPQYTVTCDGYHSDGTPCTESVSGDLDDQGDEIPVPDTWAKLTGQTEIGPSVSGNVTLYFHSVECWEGYDDVVMLPALSVGGVPTS